MVHINSSRVRDISPLAKLTKLKSISASFNQIRAVPDLSSLTQLEELDLTNNPLADFKEIKKLGYLKKVIFAKPFYLNKDKSDEAWDCFLYLKEQGVNCYLGGYMRQTTDMDTDMDTDTDTDTDTDMDMDDSGYF